MRVEALHPELWIESLRLRADLKAGNARDRDLPHVREDYDAFEEPGKARWQWYEHAGRWSNRLIHGDSRRVMSSLVAHESMAESVQMVYFDPPYGMDFDARIGGGALHRQAFVDTYEKGIHSYLDGLKENLELIHELLRPSGSVFLQIGDVNVHRAAMVLDEVFGTENRMAMITFATTGGGNSTQSISKAGDFLLWYAKDREQAFFQTLYERQGLEGWMKSQTFNSGGDFATGESRALTTAERTDPKREIPEGTRLWRMYPLLSQGKAEGERGESFTHKGTEYGGTSLETRHWSVDQAGLRTLEEQGRLWSACKPGTKAASGLQIHLKIYREEMAGRRLNTIWPEPRPSQGKLYPVQTAESVIARCMLMSTKPGDLVLDPSCGSGTTAVVAEEWGRRWITTDSAREAISIARERVLLGRYTRHALLGSETGLKLENELRTANGQPLLKMQPNTAPNDPSHGIVVERMPYVSAATLAYKDRADKARAREITWLVDRPVGAKANARPAGRFTVESEHTERFVNPEELLGPRAAKRQGDWKSRALQELDERGVREPDGARGPRIECLSAIGEAEEGNSARTRGQITHRGTLCWEQSGKRRKAVVAVWPRDQVVVVENINENVRAVKQGEFTVFSEDYVNGKPPVLVVVGADFDETLPQRQEESPWGTVEVCKTRTNPRVQLEGTQRSGDSEPDLVMVAEPAIRIEECGDDGDEAPRFRAMLEGWHWYDPGKGTTEFIPVEKHSEGDRVTMWMLDTMYDGEQFVTDRLHIGKHPRLAKSRERLLTLINGTRQAGKEAIGYESAPFAAPPHGKIGIRVILEDGSVLAHTEAVSAE